MLTSMDVKPSQGARPVVDTAVPERNFSLSVADRLRAYAQGPPAYMRRRRAIEDLQAGLSRKLAEFGGDSVTLAEVVADLARLNDLIDKHNRYYPIEANLPVDPRTGALLDRGGPWRPLARVTFDDLTSGG
jgi:hypothetical protein